MIDAEDLKYLSFGDTLLWFDTEVMVRYCRPRLGFMSVIYYSGRVDDDILCDDPNFSLTPKTREWIDYLKAKKQKEIDAAIELLTKNDYIVEKKA